MKEKFFKKGVEPKGITLIALVVTIVVLLILAGVSIAMLAGEDGIIRKAQEARLESNHSAVEEGIKLQYNEYQLQIKLGYTSNDFLTYLRNNETGAIIDEAGEINVENLLGNRLSTGNGTNLKDVYVIEESESTKYVLYYYEKSGNKIELTIIGKNTNSESGKVEVVFPEVAGLYQTGTTTLLKSWEELKSENLITVEGTTLKAIDWNLEGDLVISSEIENLSSYYYYYEEDEGDDWGDEGEARYEPNKIIPVSNINFNIENEIYLAYEQIEYKLEDLTAVYIPSSIKEIPSRAFYKANKLEKVVIQDNGVTSIGDSAFMYCSSLTSITIPNSVTSIGEHAFSYCRGLTSIVIPDSVTSIGTGAFYYCSGLTSIEIPNSVTSIEDYAFYYCEGLTSITLPVSIEKIGDEAFYGCPMDLEINYEGTQEQWNQIDIGYGNYAITKEEEPAA